MISRRQIIKSQQELRGCELNSATGGNRSFKSGSEQTVLRQMIAKTSNSNAKQRDIEMRRVGKQAQHQHQHQHQHQGKSMFREMNSKEDLEQEEMGFFEKNNEEEEEDDFDFSNEELRDDELNDYRHFDPYSVYNEEDDEEDVWYSEERLFEDHIQEIIDKWFAIDDEIWAKIICMERNRRIAKAYARKHSLTVNGSEDEYLDGTTLGLNSFENPDRDSKTRHIKQYIGQGLRIKINQNGDILVKRLSKANIFLHKLNDPASLPPNQRYFGASNSSSDLYALNSESGNDLYGIIGCSAATNGSLGAHVSNSGNSFSNYNFRNQIMKASTQKLSCESKLVSSDASTSSSSGNGKSIATSSGKTSSNNKSALLEQQKNMKKKHSAINGTNSSYSSIALDYNRPVKIFDMGKFKCGLQREARRPCPDRKRLQDQCISIISFVVEDHKMLNLPSWIMIINIVAIDLLKAELGLAQDLHDFAPPLNSNFDHRRRMHSTSNLGPNSIVSNTHPMVMMMNRTSSTSNNNSKSALLKHTQLLASKKAFAEAAASGAYNGNHNYNNNKKQSIARSSESDEELQSKEKKIGANLSRDSERLIKQSSSSSGFNSNCSSQNTDSSATSSSSNIAQTSSDSFAQNEQHSSSSDVPEKLSNQQIIDNNKSSLINSCFNLSNTNSAHQQILSRGARPPKLPHRLLQPTISSPIPIPAPPTSSMANPSGKANLILVSPTGLSPPSLQKRKYNNNSQQELPETFNSIKHIDEHGKCSVLVNSGDDGTKTGASKQKLPVGIPAHAQLAPPATQRHILKYLMSASRANLSEENKFTELRRMPLNRCQRPLPILPNSKTPRQHDENLYYCGLQARATGRQCNQPIPPLFPPNLRSKQNNNKNMDLILAEMRRNNENYGRYQYNVNKQMLFNNSSSSQQENTSNSNRLHSVTKPLMKFFKNSSTNEEQMKRDEVKELASFSSVDNLRKTNANGQKANILGLKLITRRTKKITTNGGKEF